MNLKNFVRGQVNVKDNELLHSYLKDINKYKKPTKEEEQELIRRYQENGDVNARNELVDRNQKFIYAVAKRYAQDETIMDLISEGNIGLMKAIESYDSSKNAVFLTYAIWYIRREIVQFKANNSSMIYKTNSSLTEGKIEKIENDFILKNGRNPTQDEVIDELKNKYGIKISNANDLHDLVIESIDMNYASNLDDRGDEPIEYQITSSVNNDYEDTIETDYNTAIINELMKCLTDREKQIIVMSYGLNGYGKGFTNSEIGEEIGYTSERVRQIKNDAIKKLQKASLAII